MNDADLLDLLEIVETLADSIYMNADSDSTLETDASRVVKMCSSFRTAIRQRMDEAALRERGE